MDQGGDRAILVANTRNTDTTYVDDDTQPGVQYRHGVSTRDQKNNSRGRIGKIREGPKQEIPGQTP